MNAAGRSDGSVSILTGPGARLVFLSAAALYFELALIRFTAAEVLYLGYFSNFVLLTAFVGLGVGFLADRKGVALDGLIPFALLFIFALVLVSEIDVSILRDRFGEFFFGNVSGRAGLPGAALMAVLFLSIAGFFAAVGAGISRVFASFRPLTAYSLDLTGSLLGVCLFSVHSIMAAGPVSWVVTGTLLLCAGFLAERDPVSVRRCAAILLSGACVVVLLLSADDGRPTQWSAYQKLTLRGGDGPPALLANGILHQFMHTARAARNSYYAVPYRLAREQGSGMDRVLIVGAGTGTDVAVALDAGAAHVDAVEIDGRIIDWGRRLHPDAPYADPRVSVYVADGREFLRRSAAHYDIVVFALPDSLTRISAMASVRLESYLFTEEALLSVRERLTDGGIFVMYNQYRWDWLVNRFAATVEKVFGRPPLLAKEGDTTLIAVGGGLPGSPYEASGFERLATDDWPFPYMQRPRIHWLYLSMIAMLLATSLAAVAVLSPPGTLRRPDFTFFFMGAAFMLLETRSLAFFALLFGTTWFVNSLAFAGILASVLLANLVVQRFAVRSQMLLFAGLFASLVIAFLVPPGSLLSIDSAAARFAAGAALVFAPIFFANLVFSREFRDAEESTRAFGWNLLGAVAGGGLEYLSLVIGYRDLLWIVAACYAGALVGSRAHGGSAARAA